jgi:hypothetical protein
MAYVGKKLRATCDECGKNVAVRKNGKLSGHRDRERCPCSGRPLSPVVRESPSDGSASTVNEGKDK